MAGQDKSKRSGLNAQALREFRSKVAKLKKKGVVSKRVDARKQEATKYMRAKVRKYEDVLSGHAVAVKAPKQIREKYTSSEVFEARGSFLIVPKEHERSRARIKKGRDLIEIITPLRWGEEREVVLPFKATDMMDLAHKLDSHEHVDELKKGDEQFAFRLFGHNSRKAFVDRQEFADHVLRHYQHLFSKRKGAQAIRHLSVIRFKGYGDAVPEADPEASYYEEPSYTRGRRLKPKKPGRKGTYEKQRLARDASKKRKQRANETPQQRETRLSKQRARTAKNKARKRAEERDS